MGSERSSLISFSLSVKQLHLIKGIGLNSILKAKFLIFHSLLIGIFQFSKYSFLLVEITATPAATPVLFL